MGDGQRFGLQIITTRSDSNFFLVDLFSRTNRKIAQENASAQKHKKQQQKQKTLCQIETLNSEFTLDCHCGGESVELDLLAINCFFSACDARLNEVFMDCAPPCDPTCEDPLALCSLQESCTPRCACESGLVRNDDNVCVNQGQCPTYPRDSKLMCNCNYILFTKFPRPGDSEETFRSSSQAATCPPVYSPHTVEASHCLCNC